MTCKRHDYQVIVTWTGNLGEGTASYTVYSRDHHVTGGAKATIPGTADPAFRGDPTRWNPEELLVASLAQCHMLEFLAQMARAGVVVIRYVDEPSGISRAPWSFRYALRRSPKLTGARRVRKEHRRRHPTSSFNP